MQRLLLAAVALGLTAVVAAVDAASQRAVASKVRNGKISFWSDRAFGGRAQVFVMSPDGTGLRQLTRGPERDTQASWSPDGRRVSFVRVRSEDAAPSIWVVAADGGRAHRVAAGGSAAWAPNRKRLAVGGFGLTLMRPDGTRRKTIVAGETEVAAWSRDGSRILFTRFRRGNAEVYVVRADGKRLRRLTRHPGEDYAADFSPDGRKILFSSDRTGLRQVYVMNLDGSSQRNISRSRSNDWATSWQPVTR